MCSIDLEPVEVWNITHRKARKAHVCGVCRAAIRAGEAYTALFTVFQGDAQSYKTCAWCWAVGESFGRVHGQMPTPNGLCEALHECIEGEPRWNEWRMALAGMYRRGRAERLTKGRT